MKLVAEKSVLRWGGLAGILGGVLLIFVFVFVGVIVGSDPGGLEGPIMRFPDVRALRTVENSLYLLAIISWVPLFLALYRALRETSLAAALFGSVLGLLGVAVLAAGALPHVVTTRMSDLYHAAGATPEDQATLVLLWQATQGMFDALLGVGLVLLPVGVIVLGVGMLAAPAFGSGVGGVSVVLGVVGVVAVSVFLIDPLSPSVFVAFLALIVFQLALGWRVLRLSSSP